MCGICGFITGEDIPVETLKTMNDSISHRGPDDSGEEIICAPKGWSCGMAHRRLSIMDLSQAGHQPMWSQDKSVCVVFNGEIYNFEELRCDLGFYSFISKSDTEVIIAAYLKWGDGCFEHFNGMFTIAIYDCRNSELILCRDRIGKKPLYYWLHRNKIVFGSELKPIMLYPGFKKEINKSVIPRYLYKGYINAPDTIFEDVYKLLPGEILKFKNGTTERKRYWDVAEVHRRLTEAPVDDYESAKQGLKKVLFEAVKLRLLADVPLGALLSGGYDSSLVTAIAQDIMGVKPLKTFSIGFQEKGYDEAGYASEVARHLGTDHTEMYCGLGDMEALVDDMPKFFDEPIADPSVIPTMLVSQLARSRVTTVLSGDGGDELFCGYNHYSAVDIAQRMDLVGKVLNKMGKIGKIGELYPSSVKIVTGNQDKKTKVQLPVWEYISAIDNIIPSSDSEAGWYGFDEFKYFEKDWIVRRMLLDMDTYLPGEVLTKVDRASMKYSLECRCPLLDYRVVEYSMRLSRKYKRYHNKGKRILRPLINIF